MGLIEHALLPQPQVIRNFELVGRVNLDQLDFKDKEWFSSEEEAREEEKGHIVEQRGLWFWKTFFLEKMS